MSSPAFGRRGSTGTFTDTIAEKSAEQAMLINQDALIDAMNALLAAIANATDLASLQTGAAAVTVPSKVKLVP
jgi:hypothetical protein